MLLSLRRLWASPPPPGLAPERARLYRAIFLLAAAYNTAFGLWAALWPRAFFDLFGLQPPEYPAVWQCLGMMVGVYAYGYYLLARKPERYCGFIWIALAGKTFGPLGFLYSASTGALPWSFGWICVFNDVIWWPVFWRFALTHAREPMAH